MATQGNRDWIEVPPYIAAQYRYYGIGGWLGFYLALLVASFAVAAYGAVRIMGELPWVLEQAPPDVAGALSLTAFSLLLMLALAAWQGWLAYRRDRRFAAAAIAFLLVALLGEAVATTLQNAVLESHGLARPAPRNPLPTIARLLVTILLVAYFLVSKRVNATFRHRLLAHHPSTRLLLEEWREERERAAKRADGAEASTPAERLWAPSSEELQTRPRGWVTLPGELAARYRYYGRAGWLSFVLGLAAVALLADLRGLYRFVENGVAEAALAAPPGSVRQVEGMRLLLEACWLVAVLLLAHTRHRSFQAVALAGLGVFAALRILEAALLQSVYTRSGIQVPPEALAVPVALVTASAAGLIAWYLVASRRVNATFRHRVRREDGDAGDLVATWERASAPASAPTPGALPA